MRLNMNLGSVPSPPILMRPAQKHKGLHLLVVPLAAWLAFIAVLWAIGALCTSMTLYSCAYGLISACVINVYLKKTPFDPMSPLFLSIMLIFMYSAASAIAAEAAGHTIYGDYISAATFNIYYISCLVGLAGLGTGVLAGQRYRFKASALLKVFGRRMDNAAFMRKALIYAPLIALLAMVLSGTILSAFDFLHVRSYAKVALSSRVQYMKEGSGAGVMSMMTYVVPLQIILVSCAVFLMRSKSLLLRFISAAIILSQILTAVLGGWRSDVVGLGVLLCGYWHYRRRPLSLRFLIGASVAAYIIVNAMSVLRVTSDPHEILRLVVHITDVGGWGRVLRMRNSGELVTGQDLMMLISGINSGIAHFTYGWSVVTQLLVFIPRALFPGRPLPLSKLFVRTFYPGVLSKGGGYGFFYLMEGYWALGVFGVYVFMLCYGFFIQVVYRLFMQVARKYDIAALWYCSVLYALVLSAVRSGILDSVKASLMVSIPYLIILYLPDLRIREPRGQLKAVLRSNVRR